MNAADAIRAAIAPVLPGWRIQHGRWLADTAHSRYAVIKPAGGGAAALVRRPMHTLTLIGAVNDSSAATHAVADSVVEALRVRTDAGVPCLQASDPSFMATDDGRPVFEMAVSAIV